MVVKLCIFIKIYIYTIYFPYFPQIQASPCITLAPMLHASPWQVPVDDVQAVVYCDCTKLGVMSQPEINALGEFLEKVLFRNPFRVLVPQKINAFWLVYLPHVNQTAGNF